MPHSGLFGLIVVFVTMLRAPAAEPLSGRELHERLVPSCAWVVAGAEGRGTGCIVDAPRKWLVTSFHVVGDAKTVDVIFPVWRQGQLIEDRNEYVANMRQWRIEGKVLRRDPNRDLALVELPSLPATAMGLPLASSSATPGDRVYALGNRRDLEQMWALTFGHLRQSYRSDEGYAWRTRRLAQGSQVLALQAPINEGDSGGPIVNERGEMIGIAAAILWQTERTAVAIDLREVRTFVFPEEPPVPHKTPDREVDVYRQLVRAVAVLETPSSTSRSTCFVVDKSRRVLLTTAQAAGPHERVELVFPRFEKGEPVSQAAAYKDVARIKAGVIVRDARRNLALLDAESLTLDTIELPLAPAAARPGDSLHSVGNPNGIDALWLYTAVSVRQAGKVQLSGNKEDGPAAVLVLQGPGSANDGGGPIANAKGQLVAVAGGKDGPEQQVNYAVHLVEVRGLLDSSRPKWDPKTADDFHSRAKRRMRIRQNEAALADFQQALRLQPGHPDALIDLPDLHIRCGEPDKALVVIRMALTSLPPNRCAVSLVQQAEIQMQRGKLDEALRECNAALKADPKHARAFAQRSAVWRRKKDPDKALADADEAVWLDANLAVGYLHRALARMDKRDWDAAVSDFTRAVELDPFDSVPLTERGRAFEEKGEMEKAKRDYAAAKRLK